MLIVKCCRRHDHTYKMQLQSDAALRQEGRQAGKSFLGKFMERPCKCICYRSTYMWMWRRLLGRMLLLLLPCLLLLSNCCSKVVRIIRTCLLYGNERRKTGFGEKRLQIYGTLCEEYVCRRAI